MRGVLILSVLVADELDSITSRLSWARREVLLRRPNIATRVLDLLCDCVQWLDVLARSFQQDQRDGAVCGWVPGNGEVDTDWENRVETRLADWVALGLITNRLGVSRCERHQAGEASSEEAEDGEVARAGFAGRHFADCLSF